MPPNGEFTLKDRRIWVAGHRGMVGAALVRRLQGEDCEILTAPRGEVDLTRQDETEGWLAEKRPDLVFMAAARVGGIFANDTRPAEFLYDNIMIEANVIHAAYRVGVTKLVFLGSSCIYPRHAAQPMVEDSLLTGPLEPTNQWYAIAKISGIMMCQAYRRQYGCDFISAMPTNLYGPGDNFDLTASHVVPALIRKAHEAKLSGSDVISVWGSGAPRREFLYVEDCADAVIHLAKHYSGDSHVNVGTGEDVSIRDLAEIVCEVVGYEGKLSFDRGMPEGTPRKLLDVGRLHALGWRHATPLKEGLQRTYAWFQGASREGGKVRLGSGSPPRGRYAKHTAPAAGGRSR